MLLYLHGFASGPSSFKARHFASRFEDLGIPMAIPALDEGDFEHLTIGRQRAIVARLAAPLPRPHVLIGSSMGGYLAALHASEHPVDALVLMAPAVDFASRWRERLGEAELERWERDGFTEVDHHATGRKARLSYDLVLDADQHEPWPRVTAPTLVFHGRKDDVVPQDRVERWCELNGAELVLFDAGHELTECVDEMFQRTRAFLAGVTAVRATYPTLQTTSSTSGEQRSKA